MSAQPNQVLQTVLSCPNLPTLPAVALKVLELTRDPQVGLNDLGKVVQADPALSAKVLKTVNSSIFGLTTQCSKIDRALAYLGLNAVKSLVLGFSLVDCTRGVTKGRGLDMQAHWRRATYSAAGARAIAQVTKSCDPDEAFTAAIFADIGVLASFLALGDRYSDVLEAALEHGKLSAHEIEVFKTSHGEIGAELATKWKLPAQYVDAIRYHHNSESAPMSSRSMARVVSLGGLLAEAMSSTQPRSAVLAVNRGMAEWFGKRPDNIEDLLSKVSSGAQDLGRVFEKDVGSVPNIEFIMAEASEQALEAQMATQRESVQLRAQNEELAIANITDALTGAKNRKSFDVALNASFELSTTAQVPFSVIFLDADKFKSVNDRFGHPAGDAVLKILAQRMKATLAGAGELYRYGGEEFAVIVPGNGLVVAAEIAERLRVAIEAPHFDLSGVAGAPATLPVTISLGVSATDVGVYENGTAVVKAADEAVYRSKQEGRNRVTVSGALPSSQAVDTSGRRQILLIEDDALASKLIQLAFAKRAGVEIVLVRTVEEALKIVSGSWVGAIVDMHLPDGLGTEFILAARSRGFAAPILAMSSDVTAKSQAIRSGATEFIDKVSLCRDLAKWTGTIESWTSTRKAA